jgi:asparagine synthase (glutamine-hydrolysing)
MEPLSWAASVWRLLRLRFFALGAATQRQLAAHVGLRLVQPFVDESFAAELSAVGGTLGFAGRTAAMRYLFADVLPDAVLRRQTKATFNGALVTDRSCEWARSWAGGGVDSELVDVEMLRRAWTAEPVSAMSLMLLQQAWLADGS